MYSFLLRACLGSLLKSKIGGHRSKYTCTYHSFSLAFRFSLRDSRQALQFCGTILAILGFCLLIGCGNNSASEIQSPTSSDDDDSSPPVEESVSLLKDIFIGTADSEIYFQTKMGNAIYFFMDSKEYGFELWKTDGTSDGTHLIKDIHPGSESSVDLNWHYSYDLFFAELNNELFFPANDGTNGYALWKTDGTTEGTKLVADINPEISTEINIYFQSAILHDLIRMNNTLFFAGDDGINGILIWKSDGTSSGTVLLQDPSKDLLGYNPETFVVAGNSFYFTAYDEEHGEEPWISDGTRAGTHLIKDIYPGTGYGVSWSDLFESHQDHLFFTSFTSYDEGEFWMSDGTEGSTIKLMDVSDNPQCFIDDPSPDSEVVYFTNPTGSYPSYTYDYYKVDMKTNTTQFLFAYSDNDYFTCPILFQNDLYFPDGSELIAFDPNTSTENTVQSENNFFSYPQEPVVVNGKLFMNSQYNNNVDRMWMIDPSDPFLATNLLIGSDFFALSKLDDTQLLFYGFTSEKGFEPWVTEGTVETTVPLGDLAPGTASSEIQDLWYLERSWPIELNGETLMMLYEPNTGNELWKTDGTVEGTKLVKDLNTNSATSSEPSTGVLFKGRTYFSAESADGGNRLWSTDGTAEGTTLFDTNFTDSTGMNPYQLTATNDYLFYSALDEYGKNVLWKTDGTLRETYVVSEFEWNYEGCSIRTGPVQLGTNKYIFSTWCYDEGSYESQSLWLTDGTLEGSDEMIYSDFETDSVGLVFDGKYIFVVDRSTYGKELWVSDGTSAGTKILKDIEPGTKGSSPYGLVLLNGRIVFNAYTTTNGRELWSTDGTESGTSMVQEIGSGKNNGATLPYESHYPIMNGAVYFSANDGTHGSELWSSDGDSAWMVKNINPSSSSLSNYSFRILNDDMHDDLGPLYFLADDGHDTDDLWVSDGTEAGTKWVLGFPSSTMEFSDPIGMMGGLFFFEVAVPYSEYEWGYEIWRTDGTEEGTFRVLVEGPSQVYFNESRFIAKTDSQIYFSAQDALGLEFWKSDGTESGTKLVMDIFPGAESSLPELIARGEDYVMIKANDGKHGVEPFVFRP